MGEPPPEFEGVHAPTMQVKVKGHATQDWPMRPHAEASTPAMHLFVVGSQQPPQFEELHCVLLTGGGAEHELVRASRAPLRMRAENRMNISGHVKSAQPGGNRNHRPRSSSSCADFLGRAVEAPGIAVAVVAPGPRVELVLTNLSTTSAIVPAHLDLHLLTVSVVAVEVSLVVPAEVQR